MGYFNYLPQDVWWFYIFIYLKLIDIINLLFISKSLNEVAGGYKQFKNHRNLARTLLIRIIIDKNKFHDLFMNQFDQLIIRLCGQFDFNTTFYLRYSPESLKRQFYISNVLDHLFFCNKSSNSNEGSCRSCSPLFVNDVSDFVSSIRYQFNLIFPNNNVFNKDLELLFAYVTLRHFSLDLLYQSETHYALTDSNQNRCMYFFCLQSKLVSLLLNCLKPGLAF